jgi:hypothetical protein
MSMGQGRGCMLEFAIRLDVQRLWSRLREAVAWKLFRPLVHMRPEIFVQIRRHICCEL